MQANAAPATPGGQVLWLEVYLNGHPTGLVAEFYLNPDQTFSASVSELRELGIARTADADELAIIPLSSIAGLTYVYDVPLQIMELSLPPTALAPSLIDGQSSRDPPPQLQSGTGGVLNYTFYGSIHESAGGSNSVSASASVRLEGRAYNKWGTLETSAIVGKTPSAPPSIRRLDTAWTSSVPDSALTWTVGDLINGGLTWTRPIRIGGIQLRRNFDLRPDLITAPLPSFEGSAAVPSTVDIFVNGVQAFSGSVPAGPFTIENVPVTSGSGIARVVVSDVTGRKTEVSTRLFASSRLLRAGIFDFSIEAGMPRQGFGTGTDHYIATPVASGTVRYGASNTLTLEGHAEAGGSLLNAGAGLSTQVGTIGLVSLAGAVSRSSSGSGALLRGSAEISGNGLSLHASTQRTLGAYVDLAGISASSAFLASGTGGSARAIDTISFGVARFPTPRSNVRLGYVRTENDAHEVTDIAQATLTHRFANNASMFLSGFTSFSGGAAYGIHAGLSFSLGAGVHGSVGAAADPDGLRFSGQVAKSAPAATPGSF
ncbi:MAG: fimbria/pilus outer membrane usher protein [Alphaproteobacteria bacterium]